mgnify:CR=1 FL=1
MSTEEIIEKLEEAVNLGDSPHRGPFGTHIRKEYLVEAIALLRTYPEAQPNEPLTLEELRNRSKPVFVKVNGFPDGGYWCLCNYGHIMPPSGIGFWAKDRPSWELYDRPPKED